MLMETLSILAIAVASGKAGYVYLSDGTLQDWGITVKAAKTCSDLVGFAQGLINDLRPDVVVTEDCGKGSRKGANTRRLIQSVAELASHNAVLDVAVPRLRRYPSKYEEVQALATRHPELAGYLPASKRRIFDFEPRSMVLFEALALAEEVKGGPLTQLKAARE
jgi:hypothetical protein